MQWPPRHIVTTIQANDNNEKTGITGKKIPGRNAAGDEFTETNISDIRCNKV